MLGTFSGVEFKEVNNHIEEVVKTSALLAKLKGKDDKLIKVLEKEYYKDITNLDNVIALCYYQWFLADDSLDLSDTNSVFQISFNVINAIEDTLELKPEYWILWILKFRIQSFMNFNENDLIESIVELCRAQKENKKMPYYLVSEVLLSNICYIKDRVQDAEKVLLEVLDYYDEKVIVLNNFFRGFIIEYLNVVKRSGDENIINLLEEIESKYF